MDTQARTKREAVADRIAQRLDSLLCEWKSEVDQYAQQLPITEEFSPNEVNRKYLDRAAQEVGVKVGDVLQGLRYEERRQLGQRMRGSAGLEMDAYVHSNWGVWGLHQKKPTSRLVYKKELLVKIKEIGDKLIEERGSFTNGDIVAQLRIPNDRRNASFIKGVLIAQHQGLGWQRSNVKGYATYSK